MVVKGVQFRNHRVVGDILELATRYSVEGADELVFYDITASPDERSVDRDWSAAKAWRSARNCLRVMTGHPILTGALAK